MMDMRGYNLSVKPNSLEGYDLTEVVVDTIDLLKTI